MCLLTWSFSLLTHYSISKTCASPHTWHSWAGNSEILTKPCLVQKHSLEWIFAWTWKEEKERCVLKGRKLGKCSCTHFFPWPPTALTLLCSPPVWGVCSRRQRRMRWEGGDFLQTSQSPLGKPRGGVFIGQTQSSKDRGTNENSSSYFLGLAPQLCLPTCSRSPHTVLLDGLPPSRSSPWSPKCSPWESGKRLRVVPRWEYPRILGGLSPLSRSQDRHPPIKHISGKKIVLPDLSQCIKAHTNCLPHPSIHPSLHPFTDSIDL